MKKFLLLLVTAIILVLTFAMAYMSAYVYMPLLTILAGLFIIAVLFYHICEIFFSTENEGSKSNNTNEDNTETNNGTTPKEEMPLLEKFKVALKTRNFEIEMLWKRSNYFLALNTAIAFGFVSLIKEDADTEVYLYALLFCVIGCVVSLAWVKVNLGSKFWQAAWEEMLTEVSSDLKIDYFAKSGNHKEKVETNLKDSSMPFKEYYNRLVLEKPSVSKWMTGLSFFFFLVWLCIGGFISYKIGEPKEELALIIWFLFWFVVRLVFRLFKVHPEFMIGIIIIIITVFYFCNVLYSLYLYFLS